MTESLPNSTRSRPQPPPHWRRGFWSLIVTQFQTGFNDNGLKFLVTYIVVAMNLPHAQRDRLVPIVGALFAVPFILFSMAGGYFADRYSKRSVTIGTKLFELVIMAFFIASLGRAQSADGIRGRIPDQHGGRAIWPVEIRLASGAAA